MQTVAGALPFSAAFKKRSASCPFFEQVTSRRYPTTPMQMAVVPDSFAPKSIPICILDSMLVDTLYLGRTSLPAAPD